MLCNNAGIGGMGDAWIDPMALWERVVGINLYGVVHGIRAFLPIMTDQGEGHIVNTASMAGPGADARRRALQRDEARGGRDQRRPVPRAPGHRLAGRGERALPELGEDAPDGEGGH